MEKLTLPLIIFGAMGDSINPCAMAVLIFIITFLLALRKKKSKFLQIGLVYISMIYVTYFIAGVGILSVVKKTGVSDYLYLFSALAVILAGLINIKDVFFSDKGFSLVIPESKKGVIKKYIEKGTVPAAIVLGVLVSFLELPCTGGIYISVLALLADQATIAQGCIYLLIYNLIFILPLILILILVYFSLSSETINAWRKKNKKWLRFTMGIIMICMGAIMIVIKSV